MVRRRAFFDLERRPIAGDRTLAVLTKLDKREHCTEVRDVLTGATLPVKLGIVGVVNRSGADRGESLELVSGKEEEFLSSNYPDIAKDHGCEVLKQKLHTVSRDFNKKIIICKISSLQLLAMHINKCRPDLSARINKKLTEYNEKLASLGKNCVRPQEAAFELTQAFCTMYKERNFNGAIYDEEDKKIDEANMSTAAVISKILHEDLVREFAKIVPMDEYPDETLRKLVKNEIVSPNLMTAD